MATEMTRELAGELRADITEALKAVAEKHGIAIQLGNGSYSATHLKLALTLTLRDETGMPQTKEREAFISGAGYYGLSPDDLDKVITTLAGTKYRIAGLNPRSRKMPIVLEDEKGRTLKAGSQFVKSHLGFSR